MAAKTHQHCTKITMETVDLLCNLLLQKVPQKEICQATGISQASLTIYVNFLAYHGKEDQLKILWDQLTKIVPISKNYFFLKNIDIMKYIWCQNVIVYDLNGKEM